MVILLLVCDTWQKIYYPAASGWGNDKDYYLKCVESHGKKTLVGFKRSLIADYEN
jgi:hypothetical protein